MAEQHWLRVVGFLQPPPVREAFADWGYYRGDDRDAALMPAGAVRLPPLGGVGTAVVPRARTAVGDQRPAEIANGDRLIYFALGPFALFALGTVTTDPAPDDSRPGRKLADVKTDVFINAIMKTPHFGGVSLPSGRDLRILVQRYNYLWLSPEDGHALVALVNTKAGAKD